MNGPRELTPRCVLVRRRMATSYPIFNSFGWVFLKPSVIGTLENDCSLSSRAFARFDCTYSSTFFKNSLV